MAARGHFSACRDGQGSRQVFVVDGASELQVDAESVSSEWITESEGGDCEEASKAGTSGEAAVAAGAAAGVAKQAQKRTRMWRVRHRLTSSESSSSSGSSSSRSSSTSTGSSSAGDLDTEEASSKRSRQELQEEHDEPPSPTPAGDGARPSLRWLGGGKRYRCLALVPGFLRREDIGALHAVARHPTVQEINDRKGYLAFKHRVWRFELQLRALEPELYSRLLALMHQADTEKWRRLHKKSRKGKVYPEVEYIDYDVEYEQKPCFIEPHVDNKSAVTLVAMLSPPADYAGGRSCFRRAEGRAGHRELSLQLGDAVLFRGEKLVHWITPVTSGRRVVLQIELSRV